MLAGAYAVEYVAGMQEEDAHGHPKMIALLKHFTAYSQETGRGSDSENISAFDLFDSYLPQYKIAFDRQQVIKARRKMFISRGHVWPYPILY